MPELFTAESVAAASAPAPASESVSADASTTEAGASPAAETAATAPSATDATTLPAADAAAVPLVTQPAKQGPIPFEAHKTALDNARTKASAETEAKYGWTKDIPEQHRATLGQLHALLDSDPTTAFDGLLRTIANDPRHAPALRSWFGRQLSMARGPQPNAQPSGQPQPQQAQSFPEADAEGVDDAGNRIPLYSATRMKDVVAHLERSIEAKFSTALKPMQADFQTRQQREQHAAAVQDAQTHAEKVYARVSAYPEFKTHEKSIAEAMSADPTLDVTEAYVQIVVPKLQQVERSKVAASLHAKTDAASLNPASGVLPAQGRPASMLESIQRAGGIRF